MGDYELRNFSDHIQAQTDTLHHTKGKGRHFKASNDPFNVTFDQPNKSEKGKKILLTKNF